MSTNFKKVSTRIQHKHDLEINWIKASTNGFIPLHGELIIYDIEVDESGNTLTIADGEGGQKAALPEGRTKPYTYERFKIGDGKTLVQVLPFIVPNETDIRLAEDLYTYTPIGKAQKASNEVIGIGSTISATNRGKVGSKGDSLKSVFNKIFGEQTDTPPTITTSDVKLNVSAGTTSSGGGEYGTAVSAETVNVTFTLANSGTAQYGYRCGATETTTNNATFYYPVTKQNKADIKITLPFNISKVEDTTVDSVAYKKLTTVNGANKTITILTPSATYVSYSTKYLYCNFNSSKQVSIKLNLPSGSVTTSQQTRYEQLSAAVQLGYPQDNSGNTITKFLTYLEQQGKEAGVDSPSVEEGGKKSKSAGAYTISAGSKYTYYAVTSNTTVPSSWTRYAANTGVTDLTISANAGQYIWIASTSSYTSIYEFNEVSGRYNTDATPTTKTSDQTIKNAQGVDASGYYTYRITNPRAVSGASKFKLE